MDHKQFFERALSAAYRKAPMTDDKTFMRIVKERANIMNKSNESRHRAFTAAAGTAAAVAVVGGSVFGLNWLNEHGGLKERTDIGTGAGYHEFSETADNSVTDTEYENSEADNSDIEWEKLAAAIPDGTRYEFDGFAVEPRWSYFDGMTAHLCYDVIFDRRVTDEDPVIIPVCSGALETSEELSRSDDRIVVKTVFMMPYVRNTANIIFTDTSGEYTLSLDKPGSAPVFSVDADEQLYLTSLKISKRLEHIEAACSAVSFTFDNIPEIRNIAQDIDMSIMLKNGKEIKTSESALPMQYWYEAAEGDKLHIRYTTQLFDPEDIEKIYICDTLVYDGNEMTSERETSISVNFVKTNTAGEYEFLYYIDDELQNYMTETRELSGTNEFHWDVTGSGVRAYRVDVRSVATQRSGTWFECTVDFDQPDPVKDFHDSFNGKIFKELAEPREQGDLSLIEGIYPPGYEPPYEVIEGSEDSVNSTEAALPEFPAAIGNNEFYGELLETPITGDEAWELVKERGGIDLDYNLPYDKSLFTFTGAAFVIDYADCDVTALADGIVEFAGYYNGWGNTVLIHDENGHYWLYGHLAAELNAAQGDTLKAGDIIGHTGTSGVTDHQLFAMRVG